MKNPFLIFGVITLALMGIFGMYTSYVQTAVAEPAGIFLLAADEEEEEFAIKEEDIAGPDRTWNCCMFG